MYMSMMEHTKNMKRSGNWSEKDKILLVEKVLEKEKVLFGKLKGCGGMGGVTHSDKERAWIEVAEAVNAISSEPRTVLQCRKQYDNIKQRAKERLDGLKKPQTGGGPKPTDPPLSQQLILEQLGGRPQMCGLYACLDTEVENLEKDVDKIQYSGKQGTGEPMLGPSNESLFTDSVSIIAEPSKSQHFICRGNKRIKTTYKYADAEEENLKLENKKLELETIKLEKEIVKLDLEINKL